MLSLIDLTCWPPTAYYWTGLPDIMPELIQENYLQFVETSGSVTIIVWNVDKVLLYRTLKYMKFLKIGSKIKAR